MIFDWDEQKEKLNVKNHYGVNFDEASAAVRDDFTLEEYDDAHSSADEKRYSCIGKAGNKFLYVVYTMRSKTGETEFAAS